MLSQEMNFLADEMRKYGMDDRLTAWVEALLQYENNSPSNLHFYSENKK